MIIKHNIPQVQLSVLKVAKQLPFAMSRTLNGITLAAQAEIRRELPQHFTIRRKTFIEQTIKWLQRSTKTNLISVLGVSPRPNSAIDQALSAQEFGGERPHKSNKQAIPLGARPTATSTTPPSKWPGKLKRSFKVMSKDGREFILQRKGKGTIGPQQAGHDPNLTVMWQLKQSIRIKPRWNFVATCIKVAKRDFPAMLAKEWAAALRSAK